MTTLGDVLCTAAVVVGAVDVLLLVERYLRRGRHRRGEP